MLSLEPLLRSRLADIPGIRGVYGLTDPGSEKVRPAPCCYVAYDDYSVLETGPDGTAARVSVRWVVIVAAKNVARAGDGQPAREDANAIVNAVLQRLMGWQASPAHSPLMLAPAAGAEYSGGTQFVPLGFEVEQVLSRG